MQVARDDRGPGGAERRRRDEDRRSGHHHEQRSDRVRWIAATGPRVEFLALFLTISNRHYLVLHSLFNILNSFQWLDVFLKFGKPIKKIYILHLQLNYIMYHTLSTTYIVNW